MSEEIRKVFISHKSSDATWSKKLGTDLRKNGIYAWLDIWDLKPGKPLSDAMQNGIQECHDMLLIMTRSSIKSIRAGEGGIAFEVHIGEGRRYKDTDFRIIGICREKCNPPEKLRNRIGRWLDFTDDSHYEERLLELVKWIKREPLGPEVELFSKLEPLKNKARQAIRHFRKLSLDSIVDEQGTGIVEVPLLAFKELEKGQFEPYSAKLEEGLASEYPLIISGHGGQGKTILATVIADRYLKSNQFVPFIINCDDININAEKPVKHEGKNIYTFLLEISGIKEIPSEFFNKVKFCFLIDDYHKLNPDYIIQMDDALHKLKKEGHQIIIFSRLEGTYFHPPYSSKFKLMQIDTEAVAKDIDVFIKGRIGQDKKEAFKKYIAQYDSSLLGYYFTLSFLTMIFKSYHHNSKGILRYIVDPVIRKQINDGKSLTISNLYEALTDFISGNDIHRHNPSLSDEQIIEKIKELKRSLAVKTFQDLFTKYSIRDE